MSKTKKLFKQQNRFVDVVQFLSEEMVQMANKIVDENNLTSKQLAIPISRLYYYWRQHFKENLNCSLPIYALSQKIMYHQKVHKMGELINKQNGLLIINPFESSNEYVYFTTSLEHTRYKIIEYKDKEYVSVSSTDHMHEDTEALFIPLEIVDYAMQLESLETTDKLLNLIKTYLEALFEEVIAKPLSTLVTTMAREREERKQREAEMQRLKDIEKMKELANQYPEEFKQLRI